MLHNLETVQMTKKQETELEVAKLQMLRFSMDVTTMNKIRNEYIRRTAHVDTKKQIEKIKTEMVKSHFAKGKQLRRKKDDFNKRTKHKENVTY